MDIASSIPFQYALVRKPSPNFGDGPATAPTADPPDPERMTTQHVAYGDLLKALGFNERSQGHCAENLSRV